MAVEGNMSNCDEEEDAVVEIGIVVAAVADGERRRAADDGEDSDYSKVVKNLKFSSSVDYKSVDRLASDIDSCIVVLAFILGMLGRSNDRGEPGVDNGVVPPQFN
nr:hypothetical protein Iba_chr06aCG8730 [Ipomoea batatas]